MFNTPSAPLGKVFRQEELEAIAEVVKKHPRLLVISDEAGVAMMVAIHVKWVFSFENMRPMFLNELLIY